MDFETALHSLDFKMVQLLTSRWKINLFCLAFRNDLVKCQIFFPKYRNQLEEEEEVSRPKKGGSRKGKIEKIRFSGPKSGSLSRIRCPHCNLFCETPEKLEEHVNLSHVVTRDGTVTHVCMYCQAKFSKHQKLRNHLKSHPETGAVRCPQCPKMFWDVPTLYAHVKHYHQMVTYPCPRCNAVFKKKYMLNEHLDEHDGKPRYKCEDCKKVYYKSVSFFDHRKNYCQVLKAKGVI